MPGPGAYAAALAGLPFMDWRRLRAVLAQRSPEEAWRRVRAGAEGAAWAAAARPVDVDAVEAAHARAGVAISCSGHAPFPEALAADHEAPPVLFSLGDVAMAGGPCVALVGTRRCTHYGRDVARSLGRDLAEAGVHVVSGLAAGIDGAAHEGALLAGGAAPIGVVGSGLDVVYPRAHAALWERVGRSGLLLSEAPLGARPEPWRFPARNRLIAALAAVVVVVESHAGGGSMHTVRAASDRDVPVLAVPGPVRSPASAGTNQLLFDGCSPARDVLDVLTALSLRHPPPAAAPPVRTEPNGAAAAVLAAVDWSLTPLETILGRTGLDLPQAALALAALEEHGWVAGGSGWWRRVAT